LERGVHAASPFGSPQAKHFLHGYSGVEAAWRPRARGSVKTWPRWRG